MPRTRYFVAEDKGIVVVRDGDEQTVRVLLELGYEEVDSKDLVRSGLQTYEER